MVPLVGRNAIAAMLLSVICGCGRPPDVAKENPAGGQKLPFDHQPRSGGISPSQALVPSGTKVPEGTPITIRLQSALSSASSHAGDTFNATVDDPLVIDDQTLVNRGTAVSGRVLEAKSSGSAGDPGYLRIVLTSLNVGGKPVLIETSSIFAKGSSRDERNRASGMPFGGVTEVTLERDRRLSFRLARSIDF